MALPALPSTPDPRSIQERVNVLVRDYNREDTRVPIFALDTGSATAYAIAPIPGVEMYVVGQIFTFKAANANSGTSPTLAVNGLTAGTITRIGGAALVPGDIPANSFVTVQVTATTPAFQLVSPVAFAASGATTFLAGNVALNNTALFFAGPNTGSIGANGQTWLIIATAVLRDTAVSAVVSAQIHDGTNALTGYALVTGGANFEVGINLQLVVSLTAATTFTLQAKDNSAATGQLMTTAANVGVSNRSSSITAMRLA